MKKLSYIFMLVLLSLSTVFAKAQDSLKGNLIQANPKTILLHEHDVKWTEEPLGVKVSMLQGSPYEKGLYTLRVNCPANWKVDPHWHPNMEVVTVLNGSLCVGTGDRFDESKAVRVEKGGLSAMPSKIVHYAFTKEECTFHVHGIGPVERFFVNKV